MLINYTLMSLLVIEKTNDDFGVSGGDEDDVR
jgi:hypothetical protein